MLPARKALRVQPAQRGRKAFKVHQVSREHLGRTELKVFRDRKGQSGLRGRPGPQGLLASKDQSGFRETKDQKESKAFPVRKAHKGKPAFKAYRDQLGRRDRLDRPSPRKGCGIRLRSTRKAT